MKPNVGALAEFAAQFRTALRQIVHPRFYMSERGYQGDLVRNLSGQFGEFLREGDYIVEQEYQKNIAKHGTSSRPDILIHQPFDESRHASRREGNFAAIELKLRGNGRTMLQASRGLVKFVNVLNYPVGVLVNIDSVTTYLEPFARVGDRYVFTFATFLQNNEVHVVGYDG